MSLLRCVSRRLFTPLKSSRVMTTARSLSDKPAVTSAAKNVEEPMKILHVNRQHNVGSFERHFLVWSGKYKSVADVPPTVPQETMEKARNKARIRIANYMILATIVGCIGFIYSGKQAAKRGESVQKMNLDWHKQIQESHKGENK